MYPAAELVHEVPRLDGATAAAWVLRLMLLKRAIMPIYYAKIMPPHTNEWG